MRKGFTLTEVLVAALIVALTFGGLIASFKASRSYISRSSKRLVAANFARSVLNDFYNEVRADTWDETGNKIYSGGQGVGDKYIYKGAGFVYDLPSEEWSGEYTVENVDLDNDGLVDARKVTVTVGYPQAQ